VALGTFAASPALAPIHRGLHGNWNYTLHLRMTTW
jgi:hypothetical protein